MILACQKIEKAFGGKSVLNNVNFLINEGEKAAVIGINGAGKTTRRESRTCQGRASGSRSSQRLRRSRQLYTCWR